MTLAECTFKIACMRNVVVIVSAGLASLASQRVHAGCTAGAPKACGTGCILENQE